MSEWPTGPAPENNSRADKAAAKAYAKAQRPWFKKKRVIIPGVLAVLVIAGSLSGGSGTETVDTAGDTPPSSAPAPAAPAPSTPSRSVAAESDAAKNVTLDSCKVESGFAKVGYTILNPTSKSSLYLLDIKVVDSTGAAVGTASGLEDNVLPDRPSKGEAVGTVSDSAVPPYTCEIGEVTRTSSG